MSTDTTHLRTSLLGRADELAYSGPLSFLRRAWRDSPEGADVVVSGLPFDGAASYRPGARLGPRGIRAASVQLAELLAFPWGFDPFRHLAVADCGDCWIDYGRQSAIVETIEGHIRRLTAGGALPLTFGGDHFVTYPILRALYRQHGPVALVHFDAHADSWEDEEGRFDHGTMFWHALHEGLIVPEHSVQIGLRTHAGKAYGLTRLTSPWVHRHGPEAVIAEVLRVVGDRPAYVTFDIDCLDPAYAPGTGTPVPGGLSTAQALEILRGLGSLQLIGMDVVEVAPPYDHAEITSLAAAHLAHDFLCLLALQKRGVVQAGEQDAGIPAFTHRPGAVPT